MKYCEDCKFHGKESIIGMSMPLDACYKGGAKYRRYCHYERLYRWPLSFFTKTCGRSAKWFKPVRKI